MAFGMKITNGFNETIIDDSVVSMVKTLTGTLSPIRKTGDDCQILPRAGKDVVFKDSILPNFRDAFGPTASNVDIYYYEILPHQIASNQTELERILKGILFFKMNNGSKLVPSVITEYDVDPYQYPSVVGRGIYTTSPTLDWCLVEQRNVNVMPQGHGMAIYDENGKCNWSADDLFANIPAFVREFDVFANQTWNVDFNGWISFQYPNQQWGIAFGSTDPMRGYFEKTSTGLRWVHHVRWHHTDWGDDATDRSVRRNVARMYWGRNAFEVLDYNLQNGPALPSAPRLLMGNM